MCVSAYLYLFLTYVLHLHTLREGAAWCVLWKRSSSHTMPWMPCIHNTQNQSRFRYAVAATRRRLIHWRWITCTACISCQYTFPSNSLLSIHICRHNSHPIRCALWCRYQKNMKIYCFEYLIEIEWYFSWFNFSRHTITYIEVFFSVSSSCHSFERIWRWDAIISCVHTLTLCRIVVLWIEQEKE